MRPQMNADKVKPLQVKHSISSIASRNLRDKTGEFSPIGRSRHRSLLKDRGERRPRG
jgi:hypothetical protein